MEEYEKCAWCGEECEKSELVKETHMGYLCEYCVRALESRGGTPLHRNQLTKQRGNNK